MKIFILLIAFFSVTPGHASTVCPDVNLYETNSKLRELEILNQGDMNTCYAISASTLYNMDSSAQEMDPFALAFVHKNRSYIHWNPRSLNYSIASWAYRDAQKFGVCDQDEVKKKYRDLKRGVQYSDSQLFYLLKIYFQQKKRFKYFLKNDVDTFMLNLYFKLKEKSQSFEVDWKFYDVKNILLPLVKESLPLTFFGWMRRFVYRDCQTFSPQPAMVSTARGFQSNQDVAAIISNSLLQEKGLVVGYCNRIYQQPRARNLKVYPRLSIAANPLCRAHYSVIVGSRNKNNTCDYLVRNSYGEGYWAPKEYECQCEKISEKNLTYGCSKETFNPKVERVLGCWIPGRKLLNNLYDLSYLD